MAAIYGHACLFHATLHETQTGAVQVFHGFCDQFELTPKPNSNTIAFRLIGPVDSQPSPDAAAVQMALAVLAGDRVAAAKLAVRLIERLAVGTPP